LGPKAFWGKHKEVSNPISAVVPAAVGKIKGGAKGDGDTRITIHKALRHDGNSLDAKTVTSNASSTTVLPARPIIVAEPTQPLASASARSLDTISKAQYVAACTPFSALPFENQKNQGKNSVIRGSEENPFSIEGYDFVPDEENPFAPAQSSQIDSVNCTGQAGAQASSENKDRTREEVEMREVNLEESVVKKEYKNRNDGNADTVVGGMEVKKTKAISDNADAIRKENEIENCNDVPQSAEKKNEVVFVEKENVEDRQCYGLTDGKDNNAKVIEKANIDDAEVVKGALGSALSRVDVQGQSFLDELEAEIEGETNSKQEKHDAPAKGNDEESAKDDDADTKLFTALALKQDEGPEMQDALSGEQLGPSFLDELEAEIVDGKKASVGNARSQSLQEVSKEAAKVKAHEQVGNQGPSFLDELEVELDQK